MIKIAKVEKLYKSPGPQPNGLQAAEDGLWCIDQGNMKVYRSDWETGEVLFEADTDTEHSSGITLGGGYVWVASTFELKIAKLDPLTGQTVAKYDSPGSGVVAGVPQTDVARVTGAHGREWGEDGRLYVATPPSQMIHVIDVDNWEEVHRFRAPGLRVHGLAWAGDGTLWVSDTSAGTVNRLDVEDGRVWEVIRLAAPDEVHGLTLRDNVLWYCDAATCDVGRLLVD